jgi:hypothetical protein
MDYRAGVRQFLFTFLFSIAAFAANPALVPDESVPLFDRGRIPLDGPTLKQLAADLITVGDRDLPETTSEKRSLAKLATLALRLSPALNKAREIQHGIDEGVYRATTSKFHRKEAQDRLLPLVQALLAEPAGKTGHTLGILIADALPSLQMAVTDEPPVWKLIFHTESKRDPAPSQKPTPKKNREPKPTFPFQNLQTPVIASTIDAQKNSKRSIAPLSIRIEQKNESGLQLTFIGRLESDLSEKIVNPILPALKTCDVDLFPGHRLEAFLSDTQITDSTAANLSASIAMLIDSAATGRTLRSDTLLFAKLTSKGELTRANDSFAQIQFFRNSPPEKISRLLVSLEMADEFRALLVQSDPALLLRCEVIGCSSLAEARELYFENGSPTQKIATASQTFSEIRDFGLSRLPNLNQFLVINSVKNRLGVSATPHHFSSHLLYLQASGNRPRTFTSESFALQFLPFTASLKLTSNQKNFTSPTALKEFQNRHRKALREFRDSRLINRASQALIKSYQTLLDELSSLIRKMEDPFFFLEAQADLLKWQEKADRLEESVQRLCAPK